MNFQNIYENCDDYLTGDNKEKEYEMMLRVNDERAQMIEKETKETKITKNEIEEKKSKFFGGEEQTINSFFKAMKEKKEDLKNLKIEKVEVPENHILKSKPLSSQETLVDFKNNRKWIYLDKNKFRKYQFQMAQTAILQNSLICLPTGLGKTFIATNVMYNYYNWFPDGLIIFLAPTRPLVNQQINSLKQVPHINPHDIDELTGSKKPEQRKLSYAKKRILFMTPQTLHNDLDNPIFDFRRIVLIVYDEAHRASGKYSYTEINKFLKKKKIGYRVMALTATPGNDIEKIQKIINNLSIADIDVREEQDKEVQMYLREKQLTPVIIDQTIESVDLQNFMGVLLMSIIDHLKTLMVKDLNLIPRTHAMVHFMTIQKMQNVFSKKQSKYKGILSHKEIQECFEIFKLLYKLVISRKQLITQSFQVFKNSMQKFDKYYQENCLDLKLNLTNSEIYKSLLKQLDKISFQQDEDHPKMKKLNEILKNFLISSDAITNQSKVIVFTQNRASAYIINKMLNKQIQIKSSIFIGQSSVKKKDDDENEVFFQDRSEFQDIGMKQEEQLRVLRDFKKNDFNVLVATCVAEEGLDIGEVDMIICYDSGLSPIRLIQRMGRTGRKRDGQIIMLLTGSEYSKFKKSQKEHQKLIKILKEQKGKTFKFYSNSPAMIQGEFQLEWQSTSEPRKSLFFKQEKKLEKNSENKDAKETMIETMDDVLDNF